jgi:hypothetical protein
VLKELKLAHFADHLAASCPTRQLGIEARTSSATIRLPDTRAQEGHMDIPVVRGAAALAVFFSQAGFGQAMPEVALPACQLDTEAYAVDADGNPVTTQKYKFGIVKVSTVTPEGTRAANADAARGPDVTLTASASGDADGLGPLVFGNATLTFAFELVGPDGMVDVDYAGSGSVSASNGLVLDDSYATLAFNGPFLNWQVCSGGQGMCGEPWNGADAFTASGTLTLQANTVYYVRLGAYAPVVGEGGVTGQSQATAHNQLTVGAAYAAHYKIKYSKGVIPPK